MALMDKLIKNSKIKGTGYLRDSDVFNKADKFIETDVKMLNVATSGDLSGGLTPGILTIAGPSKHFKTAFAMVLAAAFQRKHPEGAILFYDSEFGSTEAYFDSFGINIEQVVHTPIPNIEELKFDIANQLDNIEKDEPVFILIDSIGNLASKKEAEDALDGKSVADMTRAKQLKSLWRIVTPQIAMKSLYCVNVNHTYKTMELYSKDVVSGGCMTEGSIIVMADGRTKAIEQVDVGEMVSTMVGPKAVKYSWDPETLVEGTPECYEIEFEDGYIYTVSDRHQFLIDGNWVEAKDLAEGMEVDTI